MTCHSHHTARLFLASGIAAIALLTATSGTTVSAAPDERHMSQTSNAPSNRTQTDFTARDIKIVEAALAIKLTSDQKAAVTAAAKVRNSAIESAMDAYQRTLKSIFNSSTATTTGTKKTAVDSARSTLSSAITDAKTAYATAVGKAVNMTAAEVQAKFDAYFAGGKTGNNGAGGCKDGGSGSRSSGSSTGSTGPGTTTGSTTTGSTTTGGTTYGS